MRAFIVFFTIIAVSVCLLFGCSRHSSNPLLHRVDSLLDVDPDSVLELLDSLPAWEDSSEADRAFYALLWAQALDKIDQSLLPCDSLLNFALDYYDDDDWEKAVALMYKGRLLDQMNDKKSAIELHLKALEILRNYPEDTKNRRLIYSTLGLWYGNYALYDKALEVLNQSLLYSFDAKDTAIAYFFMFRAYGYDSAQSKEIAYKKENVTAVNGRGVTGSIHRQTSVRVSRFTPVSPFGSSSGTNFSLSSTRSDDKNSFSFHPFIYL